MKNHPKHYAELLNLMKVAGQEMGLKTKGSS